MSTSSITFETAALADAIKKAAKVAPSKGEAFDKAAGIILAFDPGAPVPLAVIRATDLHVFSMEWVTASAMHGEAALWRLPSLLAATVIGSLPIGTGKTVTLESEPTEYSYVIHLKSGRTRARFNPIDPSYYPEWGAFDPDNMAPASDLGGRLDQVEWATGKADPRLAGVRLDGTSAVATDLFRMARVPLKIPNLVNPVIIPAGILSSSLRQTGDVQIGVSDNMVLIMPDEYTQIQSVIFDVKYPPVDRIMEKEFDTSVKINKEQFLAILNRVVAFGLGERGVAVRLFFGEEEVAMFMANEQIGQIGDVLELPGQITHPRFEIKFTPKNLLDAINHCPNNEITLSYNAGNPVSLLKIDGGSGYESWIVPRKEGEKSE